MDADDVAIYLVDYEQTLLVPLPDGTDRTPLEIDATLAGRAFSAIAVREADTGVGRRLWLPLLDGAERLGVLGRTLPSTDGYSLARRRQPMSPAAADRVLSTPTGHRGRNLAGQPGQDTA